MLKTIVSPPNSGKTLAPYSPAVFASGILYVSGTLPLDAETNVVHVGDAEAQTRHVLDTIKTIVTTAGGTMNDITMNHIFLKDWGDYATINAAYASYFPDDKPARYCVQCGLVKTEALVEIASVAHIGHVNK